MSGNPKGRGALTGIVAALVSAIFFGLNAVASKRLYEDPAAFDAVGLFVARGVWSLPLFVILAVLTRPRPMPPWSSRVVWLFLMCGITYGPGTNALSAIGAAQTSASHAVMLLSLFPPLASFLAAVTLRERLSRLSIASVAVGICGALVLASSGSSGGASVAGDALIAGFVFTWALLTLGIRRLDVSYPPLFVVGVFGSIGCVLLGAIGAWAGQLHAIAVPVYRPDLRLIIWFWLELVLALSLGGQLLQAAALRFLPVALVVALTSYGSIFAGIVVSVALLHERLSAIEIVAGFLLLGALALSVVEKFRPAPANSPAPIQVHPQRAH